MPHLLPSLRNRLPTSVQCTSLLFLPRHASLYHSHQHAAPHPHFNNAETAILSSALNYVPKHGFSDMALTLGARDAGYLDISINLFPRSPFELIHYHLVTERLTLHKRVDFGPNWGKDAGSGVASGGKELGAGQKIKTLCVERLRANERIIGHWHEVSTTAALAIMALPSNIPTSIAELAKLSDEMWYLAGDISVDTTWYTKRATLSAVYSTTELFMTQDKSTGYASTWDFLDRRLREVKILGDMASSVGSYLDFTMHSVMNVLRSKSVIR
ncbi:COQ9-domain-containing protein [Kalaharituber pfeilii]|nr:COQ9-domain-containing protein [Kalaharituber pfeilii]